MRRIRRMGILGPRRLRPRWFRGGPIRPLAAPVIRRLRRAHGLVTQGSYAEGASELELIAEEAAARGIPRGAVLMVEAGLAWILAGELARGLPLAERGLGWMGEGDAGTRLAMLRDRVAATLRQAGHAAEAERIQQAFASGGAAPSAPPAKRDLPAVCPQCGGAVRPDEVEWVDETSAVCDYCGSVLKSAA